MKSQKKMNKKRIIQLMVLLILLAAACILFPKLAQKHISYAATAYGNGNHLYIVDRTENQIIIYQADKDGRYSGRIVVPTADTYSVDSIPYIVEEDGNAYVLMTKSIINTKNVEETFIYKCDFRRGNLIEWSDLTDFTFLDEAAVKLLRFKDGNAVIAVTKDNELSCYSVSAEGEFTLLETIQDYGNYGSQKCAYTDTNQLVGVNMWGEIYVSKDGSEEKLPLTDSEITHFFSDGANTIYVMSVNDDTLYSYNFANNESHKESGYMAKFKQGEYDFADVFSIQYEEEDKFTAVLDTNEFGAVTCVYDGDNLKEYKVLNYVYAYTWWAYLLIIVLIVLAYIGIICFYELVLSRNHVFSSFGFKMAALVIIIFALMLTGIMRLVMSEMRSSYIEEQYTSLNAVVGAVVDTLEEDMGNPEKQDTIEEMLRGDGLGGALYYTGDGNEIYKSYSFNEYRWLYTVDDDSTIRTLYTTNAAVGTPIQYLYHQDTVTVMNKTVQDQLTRSLEVRDKRDTWLVMFVPIIQGEKVAGVLEVGTSKTEASVPITAMIKKINEFALIIALIVAIILIVLLHRFMAPLRRLKQGVIEIIQGNTDVRLKVKGKDEIAQISTIFNQMAYSISENLNGMKRLTESYCRFVPLKFIELLQRKTITDVGLGDQRVMELVIVKVHAVGHKERIKEASVQGVLEETNAALAVMVPIVTKYGGVVDTFEEGGLTAVFEEKYADALNCALELERGINNLNSNFAITVTSGTVKLGIIGDETRQSIMAIADQIQLNEYLQGVISKYYADILVSREVLVKIPNAHRDFKFRMLGDFCCQATKRTYLIYDLYQYDDVETVFLKDGGKELFEKGVLLYKEKQFYNARQQFVEVLRMNRRDSAAKEYLCKCDEYYKADKLEVREAVLEVF